MNTLNIITDHIDIWTSAQKKKKAVGRGASSKLEQYGIKKLRGLILDLAVRGKLVPQDPNDEPARELLKLVEKEKQSLYEQGLLKKQQLKVLISNEVTPYTLPETWEWIDLGSSGIGSTGKTPKTSCTECFGGEVPFLGPGQITLSGTITEAEKTLTDKGTESSTIANSGDILMVCIGGSIGKSAIANYKVTFNQQINSIRPVLINSKFLHIAMKSKQFQESILENASGSATPIINRSRWEFLLIPIAPLNEQNRIVVKVDELMALCDQLEQEETENKTAHQTLVKILLNILTNVETAEEFTQSWQRISEHFDILFTSEESIEELKQTILQLAVMGKLVPQDPNDEPASGLLKKIEEEKERLVKEKKIRKQKALKNLENDEPPFSLPKAWEWVRLNEITSKITDGDHQTPPRISDGYRLLSAKNVRDGYLDFDNCDFISEEHYLKSRERCLPEKGDLLIVSVGGTIGRTSLVPSDSKFALVRSVALIKPLEISSKYLRYAMNSSLLQNSIHEKKRGGAQPCLYLSEIQKFMFSLPPLEEQHRIVKKVDELIALCDSLKVNISEAQDTQVLLADTIVQVKIES